MEARRLEVFKTRYSIIKLPGFQTSQHVHIMVENLNIQKVLAPISLTSRVKKADREKNKNQQKSFEEELKGKKEKKEGLSVDKQKVDEKTNIKKEGTLKEKHAEDTDSMESKQGKLIDLHI